MHIRETLRELWRSGAGKAGFGLLLLLLAGTVYVLTTYPLDYGDRVWSNPTVWADNPKAVPPAWLNRLRGQAGVEHRTFAAQEPTEIITARAGQAQEFRFPFDYPYQTPPTFLAVTLGDVTFAERPPLITVSLVRPDGREVRLLRHAVRAPRDGEQGPFHRYGEDPLRVQLSADESTLTNLQEFLEEEFNLRVNPRDLQGKVEQIAFGVPTGDDADFTVQSGQYEVVVRATFRGQEDKLGLVRFVLGGSVFGLMGTDTLGRDLAQGLLFGLPVALFVGLVAALASTAIGTALGILSGYLGGRTDLLIQRGADIIANVPVLPLHYVGHLCGSR